MHPSLTSPTLITHARSNAAVKTDASQHLCEAWWLERGIKGEEADGWCRTGSTHDHAPTSGDCSSWQRFSHSHKSHLYYRQCKLEPNIEGYSAEFKHYSRQFACENFARGVTYLVSIVGIFARTAVHNVTYCEH